MKKVILLFICVSIIFNGCESNKPVEDKVINNEGLKEEINDTETNNEIIYIEDFNRFNNHNSLVEFFGEDKIKKETAWKAEGTVKHPVSILYYESNYPLTIYWQEDQDVYENIQFVEIKRINYNEDYSESQLADIDYWKCKNGLSLGMTIPQVEELIGEGFSFYGLEWDYGGIVISDNDKLTNYGISLGYIPEKDGNFPSIYSEIIGDKELQSNNKTARELPLTVVSISYVFNK